MLCCVRLFYYCKQCSRTVLCFLDVIQNYPYCTRYCEWKRHKQVCEIGKRDVDTVDSKEEKED